MSVIVKLVITYTLARLGNLASEGVMLGEVGKPRQRRCYVRRGYYEETPQQKQPRQRGYTALLLGLMCLCYGCSLGQEWSENYALLPGVTASDPAFIDGKPETIGESQRKKRSGNVVADLDIPSEAIVYLPEKKSLYRIVIHAANLEEFELMAFNSRGEWDKIYDQRSNKDSVIDIRLNKVVMTTGIKLIVHRTTDDAARRRENVQIRRENVEVKEGQVRRGRYRYYITGPTTALAKIAEIELYGYAN